MYKWFKTNNLKLKYYTILFVLLTLLLCYLYVINNIFGTIENDIEENSYKRHANQVEILVESEKNKQNNEFNEIIFNLWKDIFSASDGQNLVPIDVLLKTISFMVKKTSYDDPELVELVRTLINPPSVKTLKQNYNSNTIQSQNGESKFMDNVFKNKTNGFFIESNELDGNFFSNTLYFEQERNWTGILIEAIPSKYKQLLNHNRNVYTIHACLSDNFASVSKFKVDGVANTSKEMGPVTLNTVSFYLPCFPIQTLLKVLNVSTVDYFSLNPDGNERKFIETLKFDLIDIKAFTIAYYANLEIRDPILKRLDEENYELLKDDGTYLYLAKPKTKTTEKPIKINENAHTLNEAFIFELWDEIFNVSAEQNLIPPEVILKTLKFMLKETPEYDPELIDFVRTLVKPPSKKPLNLENIENNDSSQLIHKNFFYDKLVNKNNGFFVEAGGFDGEFLSNTLFLELERNWTGLLIEAIPSFYRTILSKNRNIYTINACIGGKTPSISKFRVHNAISGRVSEMSEAHKEWIDKDSKYVDILVYVPCFHLTTILSAIKINTVDYFSLDIEGGEWSAIKDLDFNQIDIKTLTIEVADNLATRDNIISKLKENGYQIEIDDNHDLYVRKNKTN